MGESKAKKNLNPLPENKANLRNLNFFVNEHQFYPKTEKYYFLKQNFNGTKKDVLSVHIAAKEKTALSKQDFCA